MASICLNMVVKNESHIIKKTLTNIIKYVKLDYWVICDTGSSDNTIDIIKSFFDDLNIPGEIYIHDWIDFSYNRNKALKLAFNKTDYIFLFDADDEIHGNFKIPHLNKDSYNVKFGGGYNYNRICIINNRKLWIYCGVLHEIIISQDNSSTNELIKGEYYFISGRKGSRNHNPDKYIDDAVILENAYYDESEEWLKNRYAFYCAQSYKDSKLYEKAIYWYKKTIELKCWNQEKFYACIMIAGIEEMQNNITECIAYNLKSLSYDANRWEGIYWIVNHYYNNKEYSTANLFVNGLDISNPIDTEYDYRLFIDESVHTYKLYILIVIISYKFKNYHKGRSALFLLYNNFDKLDISVINNIIYNGQFFIPEDDKIQYYLNNTFSFLKKCIDKFPVETNNDTTKIILKRYINSYNKFIKNNTFIKYHLSPIVNNIETILTITSCKRPELFKRTISSITYTWKDLSHIHKVICVDDGTVKKELEKLKNMYPWIEFIEKTAENKGHRSSMNMIRNIVLGSSAKYWIHLEDDWEFIKESNYVTKSIEYLEKYDNIGVKQILFNKGYGEIIEDMFWNGGKKLEDGLLLHIHNEPQSPCGYWPHYSFRPGVTKVDVLRELGNFDTENIFFELDYANKYNSSNFKTAYLDEINCIHIGKLAGKRGNINESNSYELNDVIQGLYTDVNYKKNHIQEYNNSLPIKVINLKRRKDRKSNMKKILKDIHFVFKEAVDGNDLKTDDPRLHTFHGNDFNDNAGTIGCAISHIELWQELLKDVNNDYYIIMEDDIKFTSNWYNRLINIEQELIHNETVLLGYSMFSKNREKYKKMYDNDNDLKLYDLNIDNFIGGFFCYSINKKGAKRILHHLSNVGIKHGIDYLVMKKIPLLQKKECRPHIAFTEWKEGNNDIDTDIQNFDKSITINIEEHIKNDNDNTYIRVKLLANYCSSKEACEQFGIMGKIQCIWNNIKLVNDDDYDYLVIINKPICDISNICICHSIQDMNIKIIKEKTIVFQMEPWCEDKKWGVNNWGVWAKPNKDEYMAVIGRNTDTYNNVFWQLEQTYGELHQSPLKTKIISSICSSKYFDPGHIKRIDFLKYVESITDLSFNIDIYNQNNSHNFKNYKGGVTPFIDKSKGIMSYKYYFMCENNFEPGFITEKLWEPILCETLVFYCGAPDVCKYVDPLAFVQIDLNNFEESVNIISTAIKEDWYTKRLPNIRKMKHKLLNEKQFFPRIEKIINNYIDKRKCVIQHTKKPITYEKILEKSLNTFIYYSEYDIIGNDMIYDYSNILEKNACIKYDTCVAYNSIGFYKDSLGITLERPSIFTNQQGIYIKNTILNNKNSILNNNKESNKIVVITPCCRVENLQTIYESMDFNIVVKWIIVYDSKHITNNPQLFMNNNNIEEYIYSSLESSWGNAQRNYALSILAEKKALHNCFIYYLDDDNIIHPNLYNVFKFVRKNNIYTFDQKRLSNIDGSYGITLKGNDISWKKIDTGQILLYYPLVRNIKWCENIYHADYYYIKECCVNNYKVHKYIPLELCYWNYLRDN